MSGGHASIATELVAALICNRRHSIVEGIRYAQGLDGRLDDDR